MNEIYTSHYFVSSDTGWYITVHDIVPFPCVLVLRSAYYFGFFHRDAFRSLCSEHGLDTRVASSYRLSSAGLGWIGLCCVVLCWVVLH